MTVYYMVSSLSGGYSLTKIPIEDFERPKLFKVTGTFYHTLYVSLERAVEFFRKVRIDEIGYDTIVVTENYISRNKLYDDLVRSCTEDSYAGILTEFKRIYDNIGCIEEEEKDRVYILNDVFCIDITYIIPVDTDEHTISIGVGQTDCLERPYRMIILLEPKKSIDEFADIENIGIDEISHIDMLEGFKRIEDPSKYGIRVFRDLSRFKKTTDIFDFLFKYGEPIT